MTTSTASKATITPIVKRTVTTVENFDWDAESGEWKPTHKSVTTEDAPADPPAAPQTYPWGSPWPQREPYRPYFGSPVVSGIRI